MMSDENTIEQLLKEEFGSLSAAQRKVAEYLLLHPEEGALLTAKQISQEAGVSETTVIRLAYALNFGNFSDMKKHMRDRMLKNSPSAITSAYTGQSGTDGGNELSQVLENDIAILQQTLRQMNTEDLWHAVDALIHADRVLVAGYRASYAAAYWFSFMLSMTRDHVQLCPSGGDDYAKLFHLTEKSVAVIISVPRYSKEILNLADLAKQQQVKLIAVTDRLLSPVGRISDLTLATEVNVDTGMTSMSSVISLLNLLIYGIKLKDEEKFQARQQRLEQLYIATNIFVE